MPHRRLSFLAAGLCLAALSVGAAQAQSSGADRRLDKVERDLRTLQTIVEQAQATGQPVTVRPEGPDPALTALQSRVDDLEATLQRINGQVETLGHDLDQSQRAATADAADRRAQAQQLNDRLGRIETALAALTQSSTAADPSLAPSAAAPPPYADRGGPASDATARAQAQDTGSLGPGPAAPPPPRPPGPPEAFAAARALFVQGRTAEAGDAFQDFVTRYPTNARAPEAYYWLGESFYAQKGFQNAVAAYASALRSRPTTTWAPAAMVRLAQALVQSGQEPQACAALTEFDKRYAAKAGTALRANAEAVPPPRQLRLSPAAMDAVAEGARGALHRRLDPASTGPVALALSGGGDSVALLLIAAAWSRATGRPLLALTVDHGLDPRSAAWTERASETARAAGADWRALAWTGPKPVSGLPAAARAARHRLLAEAARAAGARVVLTGHTLDDVLEGEIMRQADAPGLGRLREWTPSPAWPEGRGLFLLRPLLGARREALRDWLRAQGAGWLDDPANGDPRYARSRARQAVANGEAVGGGPDTPFPAGGGVQTTPDGRLLVARAALREPRAERLLAAALLCASGRTTPPRGAALDRLRTRLGDADPFAATLAGARVSAGEATVELGREGGERARGGLAPRPLPRGEPVAWDGRFELIAAEPGLTVAPLAGLMARLTPQERRGLGKLPPAARRALPALVDGAGTVRLPYPFGDGPAQAWSLAGHRMAGACGLMARESEIGDPRDGARDLLTLCSVPLL